MASSKIAFPDSRDSVSSLPDEVIGSILSLLPTKLAASTSVLSKRWKNLLSLVNNLDFDDSIRLYPNRENSFSHSFFDFVDKTLSLLIDSPIQKFSLKCRHQLDTSRVDSWICTVLERGFLELHLTSHEDHCIDSEFFTSKHWSISPFPMDFILKKEIVSLMALCSSRLSKHFLSLQLVMDLITCSTRSSLVVLCLRNYSYVMVKNSTVVVSGQSIKRMTISCDFSNSEGDCTSVLFETPSLLYLDYPGYIQRHYTVHLGSLVEARLDLRLWESTIHNYYDYNNDVRVRVFGDVTNLVAGLSNLKTLHLTTRSLEVSLLLPVPVIVTSFVENEM